MFGVLPHRPTALGRFWAQARGSALACLAAALLLSLIGPFGTFQTLPLERRILFWGISVGVIWLQMDLVLRLLYGTLSYRLRRPYLLLSALGSAIVALPATATVWLMLAWLLPAFDPAFPVLLGQVALLLLAISLITGWADSRRETATGAVAAPQATANETAAAAVQPADAAADPPASASPTAALFAARLPPALTGDLLCLEMEDHYLRVHTTTGSPLILCRMADAERELAAVDGLRVHRSWWVARAALDRVERDGHRWRLHLRNGLAVPVGKTYRDRVRAAGWLEADRGTRIEAGAARAPRVAQ